MAKKKNGHKRNGITIPVAVVSGFAVPTLRAIDKVKLGTIQDGFVEVVKDFTGYKPYAGTWDWRDLQYGLLPVVVGMGVHKVASALGINRALAQAGVPLLRI